MGVRYAGVVTVSSELAMAECHCRCLILAAVADAGSQLDADQASWIASQQEICRIQRRLGSA